MSENRPHGCKKINTNLYNYTKKLCFSWQNIKKIPKCNRRPLKEWSSIEFYL